MTASTAEHEQRNRAIEANGLARSYRDYRALNGVSLVVGRGERVAIMGPSGCGKTTLLNILGGIDRPDSGTVAINGVPISYHDRDLTHLHRTEVGFVFQGYGLIPSLTAAENVEFTLLTNGVDAETRRERAHSLLEAVNLSGLAERFPEELSGGQRQRVAVARSLAHLPSVVLADEPTGNLDRQNGLEVIGTLIRACRDRDAALVVVTHDPEVAAQMDRVVHMKDGQVLVASDTELAVRRARARELAGRPEREASL